MDLTTLTELADVAVALAVSGAWIVYLVRRNRSLRERNRCLVERHFQDTTAALDAMEHQANTMEAQQETMERITDATEG
jgi:hypothetical protein